MQFIYIYKFILQIFKVYFLIHVTILQKWYFMNHRSSKIGFLYTNIRVLVLWSILAREVLEKTICFAKKPLYATQMLSQPQQMRFFINNRLSVGCKFQTNPLLSYYIQAFKLFLRNSTSKFTTDFSNFLFDKIYQS